MKDPFSYSARWDSIGLDCGNCKYFVGPVAWPDHNVESRCSLHKVSLAIELGEDGYKKGEWFCKMFDNNDAFQRPLKNFIQSKTASIPQYCAERTVKRDNLLKLQLKR